MVVIILVVAGILGYLYYGKGQEKIPNTSNPTSTIEDCKVFTYKDKYYGGLNQTGRLDPMCIENIFVKGVYFIAQDQASGFQSYWSRNMMDVLGQVAIFFESQFDNKIDITIDNNPVIIYGDKNIGDYNFTSIFREVHGKISDTFPNGNSFVDIQIFVVDGAGGVNGNGLYSGMIFVNDVGGSVNPSGFLEPDRLGTVTTPYGTDYSGYLSAAHEFGHSLVIPHPWNEEENTTPEGQLIDHAYGNDEVGSIMSYGGQQGPLIPNSFIRTQVKQRMIRAN